MSVCRNCGKELPVDATFCPNCGTRATSTVNQPLSTSPTPLKYKVVGEYVPVVELELGSGQIIYAESGALVYKDPTISMDAEVTKGLTGGLTRVLTGESFFTLNFSGPGRLGLGHEFPGEIKIIEIQPGQELHVQAGAFLFAQTSVNYEWYRVRGVKTIFFGGEGLLMGKFTGRGLLGLYGDGNIITKQLGPGEKLNAEAGLLVCKEASVGMDVSFIGLKTGIFGGEGLFLLNLTGPGTVALQTMNEHTLFRKIWNSCPHRSHR